MAQAPIPAKPGSNTPVTESIQFTQFADHVPPGVLEASVIAVSYEQAIVGILLMVRLKSGKTSAKTG